MAIYNLKGYAPSNLTVSSGGFPPAVGATITLDSAWDASDDALSLTIDDDDGIFNGDTSQQEIGEDATQTGVVSDALGNTLDSGRIYAEDYVTLTDGNGNTITLYTVEIAGGLSAVVAVPQMVPGVVYEVTAWGDVNDGNAPGYASIPAPDYDPDAAQSYIGGIRADRIEGGDGADFIDGMQGADTIYGGAGNDTIYYNDGGAGPTEGDLIYGGDGDDLIDDEPGVQLANYEDEIHGGGGNDTIFTGGGNDLIYGGTGSDSIRAEGDDDEVYGDAGNDTIFGDGGHDELHGGTGDDYIVGGAGYDLIWGDAGNDLLVGDGDDDEIWGGDGSDTLVGGTGNDTLWGEGGSDSVAFWGNFGQDTATGGEDAGDTDTDALYFAYSSTAPISVTYTGDEAGFATDGTNRVDFSEFEAVVGSTMADTIDASGDSSGLTLDGNAGDDNIVGGAGDDSIIGGAGNDTLSGGAGDDTFSFGAGWGNDTVDGGTGFDTLYFGGISTSSITVTYSGDGAGTITDGTNTVNFAGIERIVGTTQADMIDASASTGGQSLEGGGGNDTLVGGSGNDTLSGQAGNDSLVGGGGDDRYLTGSGEDTITLADGSGNDEVMDFDLADDDSDGRTNDQLDVSGLTDAHGDPVSVFDVVVSDDLSGNAVLTFPNGESVALVGISPAAINNAATLQTMGIPCFGSGTRIMTPSGERPVEDLRPGDLVVTLDAGPQPVLWHGVRHLGHEVLARRPELRPVCIRDGAIGNRGDMIVSPQHGVLLCDPRKPGARALARALHMAQRDDGSARIARGKRRVTYHHIMLPRHALILANGAWSESLYPGPLALAGFSNAAKAEFIDLFPALGAALTLPAKDARNRITRPLYGPSARPYLPSPVALGAPLLV